MRAPFVFAGLMIAAAPAAASETITYTYDSRDRLSGVFEGIGGAVALDGFGYNSDDTLATRLEGAGGGGSANFTATIRSGV